MSAWGAPVIKLVTGAQRLQIPRAIQEISVLSNNGHKMKEENVFAHTGWGTVNGARAFLTESGALTPTGLDATVKVDMSEHNLRYNIPAPPTGEAARAAVRASLDFLTVGPLRATSILWSAMYAAALTPLRSLDAMLWVHGTSGSGKSTLLNILGGLDVPSSGEVRFRDHLLTGASEAELTRTRQARIGPALRI